MDEAGTIRLLLVDDRAGEAAELGVRLTAQPGLEIVGALAGSSSVADAIAEGRPDVLLVEAATLARRGGRALLDPLRSVRPGLRPLVLAHAEDDESHVAAAVAGAVDCVPRSLHAHELAEAARQAHAGQVLFRPTARLRLIRGGAPRTDPAPARPSIPTLSAREREALEAVAEGLSAEEAAARLVISRTRSAPTCARRSSSWKPARPRTRWPARSRPA